MRRLLREPLIHFFSSALCCLPADRYVQPVSGRTPSSKQIQLSLDDLSQMVILFQSQWRREPTTQELQQLVENKVQEEILYREALVMGLEKDDTIVKRRMAQKMRFLAEDVAAAREPETAELRGWFEKNKAMFAHPSRVSFRHLYFLPDRRGRTSVHRRVLQPKLAELLSIAFDVSIHAHVRARHPPAHQGRP